MMMRTENHPPLAALCCQSGTFSLLIEGCHRAIFLSPDRLDRLPDYLGSDTATVMWDITSQLGPGLHWPEMSMIDLKVEYDRHHNGLNDVRCPPQLQVPQTYTEQTVLWHLQAIIRGTRELLDNSQFERALQRGQVVLDYLSVKQHGLPLNPAKLQSLQNNPKRQFYELCQCVDVGYLFSLGRLNMQAMCEYIAANYPIVWPKTPQGHFRVNKDTLSDMAKTYGGDLSRIYDLFRLSLWIQTRIDVDGNGVHHINQFPFATKTGRSVSRGASVLALPKAIRKPLLACEDRYLVEVDVSSQDIATAAGLSGDRRMIETYESGDFYLATAELAGELISDENRVHIRSVYKIVSLAVLYGMSAESLSRLLKCPVREANNLIETYQALYPVFWEWVDEQVFQAYRDQVIRTASGWQMHVTDDTGDRTLMNWPIQATGADLINLSLRKALSLGLEIGAVNHDALYVSAERYEQALSISDVLTKCIQQAAEEIIPAIRLRTSVEILGPEQARQYPCSLKELFNLS